jgi:hypothetical protein
MSEVKIMKQRTVVEIQAENYIEEQLLLERFPEAIWINLSGNTMFFLPEDMQEEVVSFIQECEERSL